MSLDGCCRADRQGVPAHLAREAEALAKILALEGATLSPDSFTVSVGSERAVIPERLYVEEPAVGYGRAATACFVRQRALEQVLLLDEAWAAPFVVRLVGEYVLEILDQIDEAFSEHLPKDLEGFVSANPDFIRLTRARVTSYWNCYFRIISRRDYVGFRLMDRIEAAANA
jgi:hypothetical protein